PTTVLSPLSLHDALPICNVFIFLWRVTTYADRADDLAFKFNRNTALQWRCTRQSQRSYAAITYLIFKHLAWTAENRGGARFADPDRKSTRLNSSHVSISY